MEQSQVPWTIFSSDPLFSCIVTLYSLILLYFPSVFLQLLFSPVLLITATLLICLLRFGSTRDSDIRPAKSSGNHDNRENGRNPSLDEAEESGFSVREPGRRSSCKPEPDMGFDPNRGFVDTFVEWNVRAPLEVIHEAYDEEEDEEEEDDDIDDERDRQEGQDLVVTGEKDPTRLTGIERFPSLSLCYPESDSDSESDSSSDSDFPVIGDWVSPENICFRWEEDDREGLIEIRLDQHHHSHSKSKQVELDLRAEEENMIEIDICR